MANNNGKDSPNRRTVRTLELILLFLLGCGLVILTCRYEIASITEKEAEIYDALFRYQMGEEFSGLGSGTIFYLEIQGKDPPSDFLTRFRAQFPLIMKGSSYAPARGVRLWAGEIQKVDDLTIKISAGVLANKGGCSSIYTLAWKDGNWLVQKVENIWIS